MSCSPRFGTARNLSRRSVGPQVGRVAEALGTPLMPWQQHVADVAGEVGPDGELVYREVRLVVPRQSGKTALSLAEMVHRCAGRGGKQVVLYGAQTRHDARKKWEDGHVEVLDASPFRGRYKVRKSNGNEAIVWHQSRSVHGLFSPTDTGGHGDTTDLVVIDEAFAHSDAGVESGVRPTMITRPSAQLWVISTAGWLGESPYLWEKVESGRLLAEQGVDEGVAFFEWSAPDDAAFDDPEVWAGCMPALGLTVSEAAVRADLLGMSEAGFRRAYLNQWVPRDASDSEVFAEGVWGAAYVPGGRLAGRVAFAVDVAPDRSSAAVVAAGERESGSGVLVDVVDAGAGVDWVAGRVAGLVERHESVGVGVVAGSPAAALIPDLPDTTVLSTADYVAACGAFFDGVVAGDVGHLGQQSLDGAVSGAAVRPVGDAWCWSRKAASVDVTPLVGASVGCWVLESAPALKSWPVFAY